VGRLVSRSFGEGVIRMEYGIRLEHHAGQPLAVVRRRASPQDLATVVPAACGTVWTVIRA
jgi:hypothetical protein